MKYTNYILLQLLLLIIVFPLLLTGQKANKNNNQTITLTKSDSIYSANLVQLTLPEAYKNKTDLPTQHDNSLLPFLPPTFSQEGIWNCGQAAGIGYNFTYEINAATDANGELPENQYSHMFTFNFMNEGAGWGVNYFNSFEAVKACGNPNLADYGEMYNLGFMGWKSGYEIYENAMHNRITDIYKIDVSNPEGIIVLKQWLIDHLDGSQHGGVANFYLMYAPSGILPPDSPESGLSVVYECGSEPAGHALTIVGYNDSIRYDINNDGQYTTDIDINGDNIVDMKDWEIGGFKTQNSVLYNDGKGYIMYRTLAMEYRNGGIWNQEVHVIKVKTNHEPVANIRLKLKHDSRNKLKIIAGVSANLDNNYPEHTMDFPIFNFQGGDHYMQGVDTIDSQKEIELALDISPLFSYIHKDQPAKFFVQIIENDKTNISNGEILYYSLVSGTDNLVCEQVPMEINDNGITTLQVTYSPVFDKVEITTEEIPQIEAGITQTYSIVAEGGAPPYSWDIIVDYSLDPIPNNFEFIDQTRLEFPDYSESHVTIDLPFSFPFYGETYDDISIYVDGFVMFEDKPYPVPFFMGEESEIKVNKIIAPFMSNLVLNPYNNNGVWVDSNEERIIIRWKTSCEVSWTLNDVNFSVCLYRDGRIETQYDDMTYTDNVLWGSGISAGDGVNYTINDKNQRHYELAFSGYIYSQTSNIPDELEISETGELLVLINNSSNSYPVEIQVTDSHHIYDRSIFNLSTADLVADYLIDENNFINYNETSAINMVVKNNSANNFEDVKVRFYADDEFIQHFDTTVNLGQITGNQTIQLNNIALFSFSKSVPDQHNCIINCELINDNTTLNSTINVVVNAPNLILSSTKIIDNNNSILYPGETAKINLTIQNIGHAKSSNSQLVLGSDYDELYIPFVKIEADQLNPGDTTSATYTIRAKHSAIIGTTVLLRLDAYVDHSILDRMITEIRIGHIPALIVDFDPTPVSGTELQKIFNELGMITTLSTGGIYPTEDYLSVFVCMGGLSNPFTLPAQSEGILIDYLNSSGNLYLEGKSTWTSEELSILEMFNIEAEIPGTYYPLDTINGISEPYTKNMVFNVEEESPYINYFIHPVGDAIPLLKTTTNDSSFVSIAYDAGNYKTVGSNIKFGTLVDTDEISTKTNYLLSILDFFGIKKYAYAGTPDLASNNSYIKIETFPNPTNEEVTLRLYNTLNSVSNIQVINIHGKLVYEKQIIETKNEKTYTTKWNLTNTHGQKLSRGIYFIRYSSDDQIATSTLLIR